MNMQTVYCITTGKVFHSCREAAKYAGVSVSAIFHARRRAKDRGEDRFTICGREYTCPEKVKVDPLATRSRWMPYPLHIPEDGLYAVAIELTGTILYDVFKWYDGEWEIPLAGGKVVAFQKLEPYEG